MDNRAGLMADDFFRLINKYLGERFEKI